MFRSLSVTGRYLVAAFAAAFISAAPASADTNMAVAASASDSFRIDEAAIGSEKIITPLGEADGDFKALFDVWSGRDNLGKVSAIEVSVPTIQPVNDYRLTSQFGYRTDPFRGRRGNHKGIDMAGPVGTPIYATADGIVETAGWVRGYGNYIRIEHGNQIETRYGHMSALNVAEFQRVKKGELIGFMGSTGRSTGSHLHYEVRIAGEPVDPMAFMTDTHDHLRAGASNVNIALGGPNE